MLRLQKRRLGKTELEVTAVGFGGIPIQRLTEEEAVKVVREAVEQGINFIDTARGYTTSEERIGLALSGGLRDKVYLASKTMARDAAGFLRDIETSLRNMRTDYLDLYQFHNIRSLEAWQKITGPGGAMEAALQAKQEGLIRHIGVTGHVCEVLAEIIDNEHLETIQVPFNPVEVKPLEQLFPRALELDLGIIVMKPLAGGAIDRADLALRWILQHQVSVAIPGSGSLTELQQNLAVGADVRPLTPEEAAELAEITGKLDDDFCRRCEYCLPCPSQIDIPTMFLFEGYVTRYDLKEWAVGRYNALDVKADACEECGICEGRCPYGLPIREKLKKVRTLFEG